jgi:hypothetical protein
MRPGVDQQETSLLCTSVTMETRPAIFSTGISSRPHDSGPRPSCHNIINKCLNTCVCVRERERERERNVTVQQYVTEAVYSRLLFVLFVGDAVKFRPQ